MENKTLRKQAGPAAEVLPRTRQSNATGRQDSAARAAAEIVDRLISQARQAVAETTASAGR